MMPSNLVFHSVPGYFTDGTATGTSSPYNKTFMASAGISLMAVESEILYLFKMASTFLNIQMSRYSPKGRMPPLAMLNFLSGITDSSVISSITPIPLQVGQAPYGELN